MSEQSSTQAEMHILVTGANGQLGQCLADQLIKQNIPHNLLSRQDADINDTVVLEKIVVDKCVTAIINAAAYTAVDNAESEPELAKRVNEDGPMALAKLCSRFDIPLLHVSTDYVFDGNKQTPYIETDQTGPTGVYGQTKLNGEIAVQRHCPKHIILRTAWVFSEYGNNFLKTMLRLAKERDTLSVVGDQMGCPTYAGDIATALISIAQQLHAVELNKSGTKALYGVYHYAGNEAVSWYGFAMAIFERAHQLGVLERIPTVSAISAEDYPTPAKRPAYSVLNTAKIKADYGLEPSAWRMALDDLLLDR
ncbi:dTDP-4-dehydrorhamnose reductase [Zhongshania aliphaticivorans]|uniref:dTDP-4-dehydrorhamnose reductase n=1 Tax=Zhongshania aliphaticivorans TaxID=1470434 RepID=UPI0012E5AE89|nr:dTDP-4-dehydrorhamnose reductase [Zhongshania aliphaticivorans]CAA0116291.1 dTDP-4-dehydrorhamnose reductase [Zhongshania aliphaticivorans]